VWRVQESGFIREYRKKGKNGMKLGIDPNSATALIDNGVKDVIKNNYAAHIPEEAFSGYKYPDQKVSDGSDGIEGHQNFIDLSIYHPKYGGKYNDHVPIDLPLFYCTLSQANYPHMAVTWKYLRAQPNANKLGPLARRAGMDIKENFLNVIRVNLFADAGIWVNVGSGNNATDEKLKTLTDIRKRLQSLNYQSVDLSKVNYEIYLVERPFFNSPYIFVMFVIENEVGESEFSYVRPDGAYWKGLQKHANTTGFNNNEIYNPKLAVKNHPTVGKTTVKKIISVPAFGIHNPNRHAFQMSGGACPEKGGDLGRYPWDSPGAGWPTNYEEVLQKRIHCQ